MAEFSNLRDTLYDLSRELVESIESTWSGDWSIFRPELGTHYFYQDIAELPSYSRVLDELAKVDTFNAKYGDHSKDKPITSFVRFCVSVLPHPDMLDKAFDYWWSRFLEFLLLEKVPIVLLVGLSNFESVKSEYRLDDEIAVIFFGGRSIVRELQDLTALQSAGQFVVGQLPLHLIPGAIRVDFSRPADRHTLDHGHYSHECISRMLPLQNALALSSFGRLVTGPWFPIMNPRFPVDGVRDIGAPEDGHRLDEPVFILDDPAWDRFSNIYPILRRFRVEEDQGLQENSAVRRRFASAISRFVGTVDQGYWDSVVVDLVILMESLLTPERQGGRMPLALAASNLLGTTPEEASEIFENVTQMYYLRNMAVHGEPSTQSTWESNILEIASNAHVGSTDLDRGVRAYAFEVMRDYARRAIAAMLGIFDQTGRGPSRNLSRDLQRLHLDPDIKVQIQSDARVYPLFERPPYGDRESQE